MFLKRIDILGFKSFANRTSIEFSNGITAVVGPNGSGKSNISDAVLWVLGEQSARSLRGAKMEDVIFSGSDSRRSINFCEVSLTLENADHHLPVSFDEVTVTRRLYRSGDSEYLLNQTPCRLRDISELLMDSGLGRESYSVVGQGKIEQMLSTRPEDRRGPFEDAAGIVKFKFRRREAERRLDETAANIVRVDDILAELERQAGPLEAEAERARQYQTLQSDLRGLDISLLLAEVSRVQAQLQRSQEDARAWAVKRQEAQTELAEQERALADARADLEQHTSAVETLQRSLMDAVEQRQRQDGEVALLEERLAGAGRESANKERQLADVKEEQAEVCRRRDEQSRRLDAVSGQLETISAQLEVAAQGVDPAARAAIETGIDRLNADLIEHHHRAATLRNEIKSADEALQGDGRREARFAGERERWQAVVANCRDEQAHLRVAVAEAQSRMENLETQAAAMAAKLEVVLQDEAQCAEQIHQNQANAAAVRSRLDLLKDLAAGYDGYAEGVRAVLQASAKGRLQGVHGALVNLLVVEQRYELAIETALGGAQQNVVVSTEAAAREAIAMLKQRRAGRATFMPLDVVKGRRISESERKAVSGLPGCIGIAAELVRVDPAYSNAVAHLLGNVVIASDLPAANEVARRLGYRTRIVTLEGDVVSPGGMMSGGSHGRKGPGLLGRAREQQSLERSLAQLEHDITLLHKRQEELRQDAEHKRQAGQNLTAQMLDAKRAIDQGEARLREWQAKQQGAEERLQSLAWEQEQLEAGRGVWAARRAQAVVDLEAAMQALADVEDRLAQERTQLEVWDASAAAAQEDITRLKVEVATLSQERAGIVDHMSELDLRIERLARRSQELTAGIEANVDLVATTQQAIAEGREASARLANQVSDLEADLASWKQGRARADAAVAATEGLVRRAQAALTAAEEQLRRVQAAAERSDLELQHLLERLGDPYEMTYEWAAAHYEPALDLERTHRAANELRAKMADLGDVNVGSIDEWRRMSQRMAFLSGEREDLTRAREQLTSVISEIDEEMSRRFAETFEQIRVEFQVMFKLLFNGGKADLTLTDPADLLSAGVEVAAQPPGKRLQNLNLLSGGERALTAMALLFAILRVRPVPFCVLDEVEAALDEANVYRFATQLRRFCDDTQFIVITHRRRTMEEADVLYGVTMQESGISTLISVRLEDATVTETA